MLIDELMWFSVKQNASDLHLSSGNLPLLRIHGKLQPYGEQLIHHDWLINQLLPLLNLKQQQQIANQYQLDCTLTLHEQYRFRCNIFWQQTGLSVALRIIPATIPLLSSLLPPAALFAIAEQVQGLVLITGSTGCGKSTTLASLIQHIAMTQSRHIIMLEDPIEFVHQSHQSLIQQREVTHHVKTFQKGIYAALRQDPDIILLGELRDKQNLKLAMMAAETGHLVLTTLHTNSAVATIERIIHLFPGDERASVAHQLANCLKLVVSQQLVTARQGGRLAIYEVLTQTPAVINLIRERKTHQLLSLLQTGSAQGMQTMEQAIKMRHQAGLI